MSNKVTSQTKSWCFTTNNYAPTEPTSTIERLRESALLAVIGKEIAPGTGTPHLQGYVQFKQRKRFSQVKAILPTGSHIEPAKGSPKQNLDYCSKSGDYVTIGSFPTGKHTSLHLVCEKLKSGTPLSEIARDDSETYVRHHRGLEKLAQVLGESTVRDYKTHCAVFIGPTGVGKSRLAAERCRSEPTYYKPRGKWWDGYSGQSNVIIDDFYGWIEFDEMLRILDRYPHRVPVKGGFTQFLAKSVYITSNKPVTQWYSFPSYLTQIHALLRRIDEIKVMN